MHDAYESAQLLAIFIEFDHYNPKMLDVSKNFLYN